VTITVNSVFHALNKIKLAQYSWPAATYTIYTHEQA
jgi:hypothetical protein